MESLPLSLYDPRKEEDNYESMKPTTPPDSIVTDDSKHFLRLANEYENVTYVMGREGRSLLMKLRKIIGPSEIARSLDISRTHVSNITNGRTPISPRIYVLLARLYSKKLEELKNGK